MESSSDCGKRLRLNIKEIGQDTESDTGKIFNFSAYISRNNFCVLNNFKRKCSRIDMEIGKNLKDCAINAYDCVRWQ